MKKLFSYLLISSMVVLSSCTNYDDQFDDLNAQINTLKSQIEGFSSLSSGLTALQGTVASLQSAINNIPVTPATDISGLESSLASLADEVTALQTSLASAATAAEVAALSTSLAAVQADLDDLLKQNNIYSTAVSITTVAELEFAVALGDKLNIVNSTVDIDQTADMDAAVLQSVMSKIKTVTGNVEFEATVDGITSTPSFDNLASAADLKIEQEADVDLPELTTLTGAFNIVDDNKITSVSAPKLTKVGSITNATFNKVTMFDMSSLVRLPAAISLSVDSGTVDFSSLITTTDATPAVESGFSIEIDGATIVKAPLITGGKLLMDSVDEPNFPVWEGHTDSEFTRAEKAVFPKLTGNVAVDLSSWAPKATYFHMIGNEYNDPTSSLDDSTFPSFTTGSANGNIETLILGGDITDITVDSASDLTTYTHTGNAHNVTFTNNDAISAVTFGHTSKLNTGDAGASISTGKLVVTGNAAITSITADSLDDISNLTIKNNDDLETLSFAALNSLGTTAAGAAVTATTLDITGNKLTASKIQLPTASGVLPAVAGKITESAGLSAMKTFIGLAAAKDADAVVTLDDVVEVLNAAGNSASGTAFKLGTTQSTQTWTSENDPVSLVKKVAGVVTTEGVDAVYQKQTYKLSGSIDETANDFIKLYGTSATDEIADLTINSAFTSGITGFDAADVDTWAAAVGTALQAKLDSNDADYTVAVSQDFGVTATYKVDVIDGDGSVSDATGASNTTGNITFTYGGATVSVAVAGATTASLTEAIVQAINAGGASDTWSAATNSTANNVVITPLLEAGVEDTNYTGSFGDFSFVGYSSAASTTGFVNASATIQQRQKSSSVGWRLTLQNDDTSFNAETLNTAEAASFATSSGITLTELVEGTNLKAASQTQLHVDFSNVVEGVTEVTSDGTSINLAAWL